MLDIKFIVENAEVVKMGAQKKGLKMDAAIDRLVELDSKRREAQEKKDDAALSEIMKDWRRLMLMIPNIPDMSVSEGKDSGDNKEVRRWPEEDESRSVEVHCNASLPGVTESVRTFFSGKGYALFVSPSSVARGALVGTGYLPQAEDFLCKTTDGEYLSPSPSVAALGRHANAMLEKELLPKKYLALGQGFVREKSGDSDTFKLRESTRIDLVTISEASHQTSVLLHEELLADIEALLQSLGLAHRVMLCCGADTGLGAVKKYSIEIARSGGKDFSEIGTVAYFHDFQTRRLNIRYKDEKGTIRFAHSLIASIAITADFLKNLEASIGKEPAYGEKDN